MLSAEGTGKSIEKAIENALADLRAPREDVDIKIISEGGFLKKAKVVVTISDDAKDKYIKREKVREQEKLEEQKALAQVEKEEKVKERPVKKETKPETVKEEKDSPKKEEKPAKEERPAKEEKVVEPMEFLQGFFKTLGKEVQISVLEDEKTVTYSVDGEDLGEIIGRRGEGFYALSNLVSTLAGRTEKKVLVDVGGYRAKRAETLAATARRIADKVAKSGKYMKLEPMNPSERRVIHTTLQDDDRVTTLSKGVDPRRYVIIFPKEYKDKN